MSDTIMMILAFISGMGLGAIFFGGLWYTVRKSIRTRNPAIWIIVSFFVRIAITLVGIYVVAAGSWQRMLIALAGFVIARFIIIRMTGSPMDTFLTIKKEDQHEA